MRLLSFALFLTPLLAQPEPRVHDITPVHSVPASDPSLVHIQGNDLDIFFPADENAGNAYRKANLLFTGLYDDLSAPPSIITGYRNESESVSDGSSYFYRVLDPGFGAFINQTFLNEIHISPSGTIYIPTIHDTLPLGAYNPRKHIAGPQSQPWIPIDLRGDFEPEFLQAIPHESGGTEIFIWEKQPDGTYSAQSIVYPSAFTFDRARLLETHGFGQLSILIHLSTSDTSGDHILLEIDSNNGLPGQPSFLKNLPPDISFADLNEDSLHDIVYVQDNRIHWLINQGDFAMSAPQSHPLPDHGFVTDAKIHIHLHDPNTIFVAQMGESLQFIEIEFGTWDIIRQQQIDISGIQPHSKLELIGFAPRNNYETPPILLRIETYFAHNPSYFVHRLAIARFDDEDPSDPTGAYQPAEFIHPSPFDTAIRLVADFNGDGTQDIILGPNLDGHVALLTNDGEGTFAPPILLTELAPPAGSPQLDPDLEYPLQPGVSQGTKIVQMLTADINGDGIPDLAIRYQNHVYSEGHQTVFAFALGIGDGRFHEPPLPPDAFGGIPQRPIIMNHLVDWDGDGRLDLIANGCWHENLGSHFAAAGTPLVTGIDTTDLFGNDVEIIKTSIGDINGDGHPDIISLVTRIEYLDPFNPFDQTHSYSTAYLNDGSGNISHTSEFRSDLAYTDIFGNPIIGELAIADMDLDGIPDIHHTEVNGTDTFGNPTLSTLWKKNPGNGSLDVASWENTSIPDNFVSPSSPFLDFDGDRQPEWINHTGFLKPSSDAPIVSPPYDFTGNLALFPHSPFLAADFDGDGDADFLHLFGIQLTLIKNTLVDETNIITRTFLASGILPSLAGPHADADGDGRDNFTELSQGTNPFVADPTPANPFHQRIAHRYREHGPHGDERSFVSFEIPMNAEEYGITHEFEKSHDLHHWQTIPWNLYSDSYSWDPPYPRKIIVHGYDPDQPSTYFRVKSYQEKPFPVR